MPSGAHLHPNLAYRRLLGSGFAVAFVVLALGIVCLLADLGNAERVVLLLLNPTASYLSVGSWALVACLTLAAALGFAWLGVGTWNVGLVRILLAVAALVATVVMVYTGLLLQSLGAVPLWTAPWVPLLFAVSSLSCGLACTLALAQITGVVFVLSTVLKRLAATAAGRCPVRVGLRFGRRVRHAFLHRRRRCAPCSQLDGSDVICFRSKWIRPPTCPCGCSCASG